MIMIEFGLAHKKGYHHLMELNGNYIKQQKRKGIIIAFILTKMTTNGLEQKKHYWY